ncbi:hypothetical protein [Syntrophus gentianae]|nr:hypothetical protein [Syntrophus gentianae]
MSEDRKQEIRTSEAFGSPEMSPVDDNTDALQILKRIDAMLNRSVETNPNLPGQTCKLPSGPSFIMERLTCKLREGLIHVGCTDTEGKISGRFQQTNPSPSWT